MRAYSLDLQERIVRACVSGGSTRQEIADDFGISRSFVSGPPRLIGRMSAGVPSLAARRETAAVTSKPSSGSCDAGSRESHCLLALLKALHRLPTARPRSPRSGRA
jgi:hypothetical protein